MSLKKFNILTSFLALFLLLASSSSLWAAEGKAFDLSAYKGKVVMVDFWASWCAPCRKSFPWLNQMQQAESSKDLVILGVNVDEDSEDAKEFLEKNKAIFKIMYDPKGEYASFYDIPGMPSTLIFDREGQLLHKHSGFKTKKIKEYEELINQTLAK